VCFRLKLFILGLMVFTPAEIVQFIAKFYFSLNLLEFRWNKIFNINQRGCNYKNLVHTSNNCYEIGLLNFGNVDGCILKQRKISKFKILNKRIL
jgi:hypothetical protein